MADPIVAALVEHAPRQVQAVALEGRVMGTAEFISRVLLIPLEPWQYRICDWIDSPEASQG
ncbi:MAG TPA: hypothetical protein VGB54_11180 [Allosphingosinicella sp.]|jgi:hypothetical protein